MSLLDHVLGRGPLPPRARRGFHLHPHVLQPGDVERCMELGSLIRMQAPADIWSHVVGIVRAAPKHARFLLIVQPPVPERGIAATPIAELVKRLATDDRVAAWQIGNEPNTTANDSPSMSPEQYVQWAGMAAALVRQHDAFGRPTVSAATTSVIQDWPATIGWSWEAIEAGLLNYVHHFAIHHYGSDLYRVALGVRQLVDYARAEGAEQVWLTETGQKAKRGRLRCFHRTFRAYQLADIELDQVVLYSWRGDERYDLHDDRRMLRALQEAA